MRNVAIGIKKHPITSFLFFVYIVCWLFLCYATYHEFSHQGEGESIGIILYYTIPFLFGPYVIINLVTAYFSEESRPFFTLLGLLVICSLGLLVLFIIILSNNIFGIYDLINT